MKFKSNNFIERSITGAISFFKESVFSDEYALKKGFLQSIEPRFKAISFTGFLLAAIFIKSTIPLLYLYLICLLLAYLSKIHLGFFLKRTWIFIPLFSLFIAIPAVFGAFTPGEPIFGFEVLGLKLIISRQGLFSALLFVSRVITSVSFVVLLSLVTRHTELLSVLRIFKVPQIFVMTLSICYRYIYLFVETIENTYFAIKSRVGQRVRYEKGQRIVAGNIGNLWQRTSQLNTQVYNAMLSRGYAGEPRVFEEYKAGFKDWLWLIFAAVISGLIVYLDKYGKFHF